MIVRKSAPWVAVPLFASIACAGDGRTEPPPTTTDRPPSTAGEGPETGAIANDGAVTSSDAGAIGDAVDAEVPAVSDAAGSDPGVDSSVPAIDCLTPGSGIVCDDGLFCNGVERCEPGAAGADVRGCVAGALVVCAAGERCSELNDVCSACDDVALDDADGDGHEAASCGGDDCRDDDPTTFPGQAETCNGKDDDCDGNIDGVAADAACMAAAPALSTSSCGSGNCVVLCTDPDSDLVAGSCVKHDDCAGVTACAAGTCVDGVRSYTCTCPSGYTGSGTTACTDIDECASTNPCDTSPKACANKPGSYACECPDTHYGDGMGERGCARKAVQIAAGTTSTCVVLSGGKVKCWGDNSFGKLGVAGATLGSAAGQMGDALPTIPFGSSRTATKLAAGSDVTCAVLADGAAKCWGYNNYGACGGPPDLNGLGNFDAPLPVGRKASSVGAGSGNGFAVLDDGTFGHWGFAFGAYTLAARVVAFDRSPVYNRYHVCAVLEGGVLNCWPSYTYYGEAVYGEFGFAFDETLRENLPAIAVGTGRTVSSVALGNNHTCALLDSGDVKCWGRNDYGQLGLGDTTHRGALATDMGDALPALPLGASVRAIAAGAEHTCALLDGGNVKCWGLNDQGQLGQGTTDNVGDQPGELAALPAVDLGSGRTAVAIDVGAHSCALLDDGSVKCWGPNVNGELGQGDASPRGHAAGTMGDALKPIDLGE